MPDIKTRDIAKGTIKTIDKSAVAAERMKSAFIQTKEKAEHSVSVPESSAEEYASNRLESGIDRVSHEAVHQFDKQGRKGVQATKQNIVKAKDGIQKFKEKRAAQSLQKQAAGTVRNKGVKVAEQTQKTVKESARSAGKKTIKTVGKGSAKTAQKTVKTAERTAKTTVKTAQRTAKAAQKTAQATVKASQRAVQAARAAAKAAVVTAKAIAKAIALAVKAIIAGTKALIAAIAAGGWIAVLVIIVICLIGMIIGSVFGIFFSGEDSGTGMSMQTVVQEINTEYDTKLQDEKTSVSYDVLEMSGSRAVWKEVLAVYSVKTNTDQDNPQEVATMDDGKKQLLKDIFWEMNQISSRTESKTETVITETDDGHGNILLSRVEASDILAWDKLEELKTSGEVLDVVVKGITNAGVIAYVEGVRGFIPASKLALGYVEDTEEYLNKPIQVQVIDVDKDSKKLILSAKEILRAKAEEERKNKVSNLEIGLVTEGTVESLQPYGAFVDLGNGLSGLVHISQICEKRIKKPSEVLAVGDKVKVKVTAIKDGKLSLSIKEASDMMAKEIEEEVYEVPDAGQQATTSLGSLFANIKLD